MAWVLVDSDNFNRADEIPIASPWTGANLDLRSNALYANAIFAARAYLTTAGTYAQKQAAACNNVTQAYSAIGCRASDNNNFYIGWNYSSFRLWKFVSGSGTVIANVGAGTLNSFGITADGTTIELVTFTGSFSTATLAVQNSQTDATFSTGKAAIAGAARNGNPGCQDYEGYSDGAGAADFYGSRKTLRPIRHFYDWPHVGH